jgi:hypothetical protein
VFPIQSLLLLKSLDFDHFVVFQLESLDVTLPGRSILPTPIRPRVPAQDQLPLVWRIRARDR